MIQNWLKFSKHIKLPNRVMGISNLTIFSALLALKKGF